MTRALALLLALLPSVGFAQTAAPRLRAEVVVTADLITAADLVDAPLAGAGAALFEAPAPGASGRLSLARLREAFAEAGLPEPSAEGFEAVSVHRILPRAAPAAPLPAPVSTPASAPEPREGVAKGAAVTAVYEGRGFTLRLAGRALEAAAVGEAVAVEVKGRRAVDGLVTARGVVTVGHGGRP